MRPTMNDCPYPYKGDFDRRLKWARKYGLLNELKKEADRDYAEATAELGRADAAWFIYLTIAAPLLFFLLVVLG